MKNARDFLTESHIHLKNLKIKMRQRIIQSWEKIMNLSGLIQHSTTHYESKLKSVYKRIDKAVEEGNDVLIAQLRDELDYINRDKNKKAPKRKRNSFF